MENPKLIESEFLFAFLSPSCEKLKTITPSPKRTKFSFSTLFKSSSNSSADKTELWGMRDNDDDDDLLLVSDGNESSLESVRDNKSTTMTTQFDDLKDSIAEPIYQLLSEIFDLTGPFKFLRKSLISFVQLTYGGTINRQIRDLIGGCFDENNLHHYLSSLLKTLWPVNDEEEEKSMPERTDDMKEMTALAAKSLIIDNIPDILNNLVGAQNAKNGSIKIFEILQNEKYNKQLIYDLLEVLLVEVFPEIKNIPQPKMA
jgi:sorting nexin-25